MEAGIEPGTSEIAEAIAGVDLSFYAFEGKKTTGNADLHITSARIDEPQGLALVKTSERGRRHFTAKAMMKQQVVFIGGRDAALCARLRDELIKNGFVVQNAPETRICKAPTKPILQSGQERARRSA